MLPGFGARRRDDRRGRTSPASCLMWPSGNSLLVYEPFHDRPHPTQFIPPSCNQTNCCCSPREEVGLNPSDSGSWSRVDLAHFPPVLPLCEGEEEGKGQNALSLFAPPLSCLSISPSLWELSCLFSCPSLTKYVNEQMDSGFLPCTLFYCTGRRTCINWQKCPNFD